MCIKVMVLIDSITELQRKFRNIWKMITGERIYCVSCIVLEILAFLLPEYKFTFTSTYCQKYFSDLRPLFQRTLPILDQHQFQ